MILSAMALSVQDRSGSSHRRNDADLFEVSAKRDHLLLGAAGVGLALPFCPGSFRAFYRQAGQRSHKKLTEQWARQLLLLERRWYPRQEIVTVADRTYASLKLLDGCRKLSDLITLITRLRLDAALYEPAPPQRPH